MGGGGGGGRCGHASVVVLMDGEVAAGAVTVEVASLAVSGAASLTDFARVVTVGVASLADAGVAFLADAGVASPTDLAVVVTVGVGSLADAGAASLADAGVASRPTLLGFHRRSGVPSRCWGGIPGRSGWQCCWWNDELDCAGLCDNRRSDVSTEASWPGLFGHAWFCDW